ncbi:exocyst complex component EXO70A1-like protein [Tanacetum coccineum]
MQLNFSCYCLTEEVLGAISGDNKRKEVDDSVSLLYRIFDIGDILKFLKVAFHTGYDKDAQIQSVVEKRDTIFSDTSVTLNALHETEVDSMKFDGLLDEAILNLQDEYEGILQRLKHHDIAVKVEDGDDGGGVAVKGTELGKEMEVEALRRISETLTANDFLDICIDIFVKVHTRDTKHNETKPILSYYKPEVIDDMEWKA